VDAFFPSDDELHLADAARDPAAALAPLCTGQLRFIAWKRGATGGVLYDTRTRRAHAWSARVARADDPTGAGDAFMAAFVSAQLERDDVESSLRRGVVTASFAIEAWGPDGLLGATPDAARTRLAAWEAEQVRS
jgi:ribokinase